MAEPVNFPTIPGPLMPVSRADAPRAAEGARQQDFARFLVDSLNEVSNLQQEADLGVERLMTGQTDNVAEVMSSVRKAEVAFSMLMEIRNKLLEAYSEVRQMQV